jgi:hypothetical protein
MKFPSWLKVFGDKSFRGACPKETLEQITFFTELKKIYPELWSIAIHPKNEGLLIKGQFQLINKDKAMGMRKGAADIVIPTGFVCELKRQDHTKSSWQEGQKEYLKAVHDLGGFACIALGYKAAIEAVKTWKETF